MEVVLLYVATSTFSGNAPKQPEAPNGNKSPAEQLFVYFSDLETKSSSQVWLGLLDFLSLVVDLDIYNSSCSCTKVRWKQEKLHTVKNFRVFTQIKITIK